MKVFISWSGDVSHKAALALREWLPSVVQSVEPFVSSEDIRTGTRWANELAQTLENYSVGVICLTPQNIDARWINFEAGALSKSIADARVMSLLIGLRTLDVQGPLGQFQVTPYEEEHLLKMVIDINESAPHPRADEMRIRTIFERFWPDLKQQLDPLVEEAGKSVASVEREEIDVPAVLEEILSVVRGQQQLLSTRLPRIESTGRSMSSDSARKLLRAWYLVDDYLIADQDPATIPHEVWEAASRVRHTLNELLDGEEMTAIDRELGWNSAAKRNLAKARRMQKSTEGLREE